MTSANPGIALPIDDAEAHYGITRVTIDQFEIGGYRYSNLKDAIAEAKRRQPKTGDA